MNVLIYTLSTPRPNSGGISRMTFNIAKELSNNGHKIFYLCFERYETDVIIDNVYYFPVLKNCNALENKHYLKDFILKNQISFIINQIPLSPDYSDLLYKVKPNVVRIASVIHNSSLNLVRQYAYSKEYSLKRCGKGLIFNLLCLFPVKQFLVLMYILKHRKHYKNMESGSDYIVAVSKYNKPDLYRLIGFKSDKVISIDNFIEVNHEPLPEKENIVLWCGRVETNNKRVDLILDIWSKICRNHPDWKLVILGHVEDHTILDYAKSLKLINVEFAGLVKTEDYYKRASIFCHTSISESFGLVLVEAMNWGCVPMAFDSFPACKEIIPDNCGYRIKAFDKEMYASKLSHLIKDPVDRKQFSISSKVYSERFNSCNSINQWLNIIK